MVFSITITFFFNYNFFTIPFLKYSMDQYVITSNDGYFWEKLADVHKKLYELTLNQITHLKRSHASEP